MVLQDITDAGQQGEKEGWHHQYRQVFVQSAAMMFPHTRKMYDVER